ncbi:muts domain V-domain-containing protein [Gongronella butleri]|nr:muts domain V-domain-containing protein [Gongronella butleri]
MSLTPSSRAGGDETTIMCMLACSGNFGCVYYVHALHKLFFFTQTKYHRLEHLIKAVLLQVQPSVVVLSSSQEADVVDLIRLHDASMDIVLSAPKLFNAETGTRTLIRWYAATQMRLFDDSMAESAATQRQALLQLYSVVPMKHLTLLSCVTPILDYIQSYPNMSVLQIQTISLHTTMHLSSDALLSLQILDSPEFPSKKDKPMSLYGLLNHTVTPGGAMLLKDWLLSPSLDLNVIQSRHALVAFFCALGMDTINELRDLLKHIKNTSRILLHVNQHRASIDEWRGLLEFAYYCLSLVEKFSAMSMTHAAGTVVTKVAEHIDTTLLETMGNDINNTARASENEGRVTVQSNIDANLDDLRVKYNHLDDYLARVAQMIAAVMPIALQPVVRVVYYPQLGYFVTVPRTLHQHVDRESQHLGLALQFTTEHSFYYKNSETYHLDNTVGDVHAMIIDRQIELIQALGERVLEFKNQLLVMTDICTELDCILAFSYAALRYNYHAPRMTEQPNMTIVHGRHPLYEHSTDAFITNNTMLDSPIMLLTGANSSGKSVYLKQNGLIVVMAHIGSFVPADEAVIGLTDKIFTSIQTTEAIDSIHSAFSYDMQQVTEAIRYATPRSLVLLDEFGKGTNPLDGASLLAATLHYFGSMESCPRVFATTHFHELIQQGVVPDQAPFGHFTMLMLMMTRDGDVEDEEMRSLGSLAASDVVEFHYRVTRGHAAGSFGLHCGHQAGLSAEVLERARILGQQVYGGGRQSYRAQWTRSQQDTFAVLDDALVELLEMHHPTIASTTHLFQALGARFPWLK